MIECTSTAPIGRRSKSLVPSARDRSTVVDELSLSAAASEEVMSTKPDAGLSVGSVAAGIARRDFSPS